MRRPEAKSTTHPPAPRGPAPPDPDRVFRETFLWRFGEAETGLLERLGEFLLDLTNEAGFLPDRGLELIPAQLAGAAADLDHLALFLHAVAATPTHSEVSDHELQLCRDADRWAQYLEVAVHALRRETGVEVGDSG